MNPELFGARATDRVDDLLGYFSALGITASPVLADDGSVAGMISLRDLIYAGPHQRIYERMTTPVIVIHADSSIEEAARLMYETDYHRLPVVDRDGAAVGIVSSLDVIRGLTGQPARHPSMFPHYDKVTGVAWTDDVPLDFDHVERAPAALGILALVHGGAGVTERVVWAEMSENMRARLGEILASPERQHRLLRDWLEQKNLRFRTARLSDPNAGPRIVDILQRDAGVVRD